MSVQHRALRGTLFGGASLFVNFGLTVIQVPILLHFWDKQFYGLWLTMFSAVSLLTALDTGHQDYVGNLFSRLYVENFGELKACLASALLIALMLGVVELLVACALIISGKLDSMLGGGHGALALREARWSVLLYVVSWIACGSVGGVLVRLYMPRGLYARTVGFSTLMRIAQFLALIGAAMCTHSLLITMGAYCFVGFVVNAFIFIDMRRQFRDLWPWWRGGSLRQGWRNFRNSLVLTCSGILDQTSSNGVVLLVAHSLGAGVVPQFTTLRTVANVVTQGATILIMPLAPDFARYQVKRDAVKIAAVLSTAWTIGGTLVNGGVIVIAAISPVFYRFWTHGKLTFDANLFYLLSFAVVVRCGSSGAALYLISINQIRAQLITTLTRGLLTVGLLFPLLPRLGLNGAGVAILVAELFGSLGIVSFFTWREIRSLGGVFPWQTMGLNFLALLIMGIAFIIAAIRDEFVGLPLVLGLIGIVSLGILQWRRLPRDVHERLLSLPALSQFRASYKKALAPR